MNRGIKRTAQLIGVIGTLVGISAGADAATVRVDFDNDGHADIFWHRGGTGELDIWHMSGATTVGGEELLANLVKSSTGFRCVGLNDFNNDGHVDLLWHNGVTGETQIWFMNGGTRTSIASLDPSLNIVDSSGWRVVGTADFNRDGKIDILWHNGLDGSTVVWYMNGSTFLNYALLDPATAPNIPDTTGWQVVGASDFNGDQMPDILWHNGQTGETQVWYMNGVTVIQARSLDSSLNVADSSGWTIAGVDDYDGDLRLDLLWHNGQTGDTQIWTMSGLTRLSVLTFPASRQVPDATGWRIVNNGNVTLQASSTTTPASSDPYAARTVTMTAFNTVQTNDPTINGLGITSINVATDISGQTLRMQGTGTNQFIDYYVSFPNTLPSGAPDPSYFTFDFRDSTGEFAGFQDLWSWNDPQGVTHIFFDQQVNGEYHLAEFTVDSAGNVITGSEVQAKATTRPDRCKIISDWGALQCPRSFGGPQEIPTAVRSHILGVGFFSSLVGTVWNNVQAAANSVNKVIRDPEVIADSAILVAAGGALYCCAGVGFSPLCLGCIALFVIAGEGILGAFENQMDPSGNTSRALRASGVIGCNDPACGSIAACQDSGSPTVRNCASIPSVARQCPSGWHWSTSITDFAIATIVLGGRSSPVGGYCIESGPPA